MVRKRSTPHTLHGQLSAERKRLEAEAALLPVGPAKDVILGKIRDIDAAAKINDWLTSPGLKPPD